MYCLKCRREYSEEEAIFRCGCGGLLEIDREVSFPKERIALRARTLWRYREALPVEPEVSFMEGLTPLVPAGFDSMNALLKLDFLFPTGSYKDRGSTVMISKVRELGISSVVEDSSGNAGASVAAYSARAGIRCRILVPHGTSKGKLAQIKAYGAELEEVKGSRYEVAEAALKEAQSCYYASHNMSPFFIEGTKTLAYEITEQLDWNAPDALVAPSGNGSIIIGAFKGFNELRREGVIDSLPRIYAVQADAVSPVYQAFKNGRKNVNKVEARPTIAEGIALANPVRGDLVLEAVRETKGGVVAVSETDILKGQGILRGMGLYVEPTSAVVVPALKKLFDGGELARSETVVMPLTGTGLKK